MAAIKSSNTKPEIEVRKFLHTRGLRYSLNRKDLPGKPDIVLPARKSVVFVHGCFWHGHKDCKHFRLPKTRTEWWAEKIEKNKIRDKKVISELERAGWTVEVIWACQVSSNQLVELAARLLSR